jgi:hypothetical protein
LVEWALHKLMGRFRKLLAPLAAALLLVPMAGARDASGQSRTASGWTARLFVQGMFTGLVAAPGGLYAAESRSGVSTIVRVGPLTGHVLARSSDIKDFGGFSLITGQLWVVTSIGDVGRQRVPELLAFDLKSLKQVRVVPLRLGPPSRTAATAWGPLAAPGATAWAAFGCELVQVDLSSGRLLRSGGFGKEIGCSSQFAIEEARLYVAEPEGLGGSIHLEERNARTGALLAVGDIPDPPLGVALAASAKYLWAAGGDMGEGIRSTPS